MNVIMDDCDDIINCCFFTAELTGSHDLVNFLHFHVAAYCSEFLTDAELCTSCTSEAAS